MAGQIIKRGDRTWMLRVFLGRAANGKRTYLNETFQGTKKKALERLNEMLTDFNAGTFIKPQKTTIGEFLRVWLESVRPTLSRNGRTRITPIHSKSMSGLLWDPSGLLI